MSQVTLEPRCACRCTGRFDDRLIVVNGEVIGGVYYRGADYIAAGERWASWGPAGGQTGFRYRRDAVAVQVGAASPAAPPLGP